MNPNDLQRLEGKVDLLADAITKLVLFEERQSVHATALLAVSTDLSGVKQKLDMWVNRGIGVWAVFASALVIYRAVGH